MAEKEIAEIEEEGELVIKVDTYQPVIREKDIDSGGDEQEASQDTFKVDNDGNIELGGSIDASSGAQTQFDDGSMGTGLTMANASFSGILTVFTPDFSQDPGSLPSPAETFDSNGKPIKKTRKKSGVGTMGAGFPASDVVSSIGGGSVVIVGASITSSNATSVYINVPAAGASVDCETELIQAEMDEKGMVGITPYGAVSDGPGGHQRADSSGGNGCDPNGGGGGNNSYDTSLEGAENGDRAAPNTIVQHSVGVDSDTGNVDEQLELSAGSDAPTVQWRMEGDTDGLAINERNGKLSGKILEEDSIQNVTVTATDGTTEEDLDSKTYALERTSVKEQKMIPPLAYTIVDDEGNESVNNAWKLDSGFGPRSCSGCSKNHKGLDYNGTGGGDTDEGDPVVAVLDGVVSYTGYHGGTNWGNMMIVDHYDHQGNIVLSTGYAHLEGFDKAVGDKVPQGTQIARLGRTGTKTAHLHFEAVDRRVHHGSGITNYVGNQTDPTKWINGKDMQIAAQGGGSGTGYRSVTQDGRYVGGGDNGGCNGQPAQAAAGSGCESLGDARNGVSGNTTCSDRVSKEQVIQRMDGVFDKHQELDDQDRELLHFMARIESNYDPCVRNKQGSSAYGLFQMVDKTANGYPHDRSNIEASTEAQISFYKKELLPYYEYFQESNGAGFARSIPIKNKALSNQYASYSKTEMLYGLLHHDGVGNAQKGRAKGGVAYVQGQMKKFGFN